MSDELQNKIDKFRKLFNENASLAPTVLLGVQECFEEFETYESIVYDMDQFANTGQEPWYLKQSLEEFSDYAIVDTDDVQDIVSMIHDGVDYQVTKVNNLTEQSTVLDLCIYALEVTFQIN